mgnify:CR=1 FL=1
MSSESHASRQIQVLRDLGLSRAESEVYLACLQLGAGGIAGVSMNIAWILFVVGIAVAIIFFVLGRRPKL